MKMSLSVCSRLGQQHHHASSKVGAKLECEHRRIRYQGQPDPAQIAGLLHGGPLSRSQDQSVTTS